MTHYFPTGCKQPLFCGNGTSTPVEFQWQKVWKVTSPGISVSALFIFTSALDLYLQILMLGSPSKIMSTTHNAWVGAELNLWAQDIQGDAKEHTTPCSAQNILAAQLKSWNLQLTFRIQNSPASTWVYFSIPLSFVFFSCHCSAKGAW